MKISLQRFPWIPSVNLFLHIMVYLSVQREGQMMGASPTIYMKEGDNVQFPFTPAGNHHYKVELIFNSSVVMMLFLSQLRLLKLHDQYKERVNIQNNTIYLQRLQLSDTGVYELIIDYFSGPRAQTEEFHLQVLEPVSKPNITAECQSSNFTLSCSSGQGSDVEYSWEILCPHGNSSFVQQGSVIQIDEAAEWEQPKYKCTAQNKISRETSDPLDLGVCIHNARDFRWIPALCAMLTLFFMVALMCKYKKGESGERISNTGTPNPANNEMI